MVSLESINAFMFWLDIQQISFIKNQPLYCIYFYPSGCRYQTLHQKTSSKENLLANEGGKRLIFEGKQYNNEGHL